MYTYFPKITGTHIYHRGNACQALPLWYICVPVMYCNTTGVRMLKNLRLCSGIIRNRVASTSPSCVFIPHILMTSSLNHHHSTTVFIWCAMFFQQFHGSDESCLVTGRSNLLFTLGVQEVALLAVESLKVQRIHRILHMDCTLWFDDEEFPLPSNILYKTHQIPKLDCSRLALTLFLLNPLKPDVKSRMKT